MIILNPTVNVSRCEYNGEMEDTQRLAMERGTLNTSNGIKKNLEANDEVLL